MRDNSFITEEAIMRATVRPPKHWWLDRVLAWWRKTTGRDHYYVYVGSDVGIHEQKAWCLIKRDMKTGAITVVQSGTGDPPPLLGT